LKWLEFSENWGGISRGENAGGQHKVENKEKIIINRTVRAESCETKRYLARFELNSARANFRYEMKATVTFILKSYSNNWSPRGGRSEFFFQKKVESRVQRSVASIAPTGAKVSCYSRK
jgi:hypothetical protein